MLDVRTDFSEDHNAFIIRVTRISELGTTLTVTLNRSTLREVFRLLMTANNILTSPALVTLMLEAIRSSETSAPTRVTQR
jgi:hypothetical protein